MDDALGHEALLALFDDVPLDLETDETTATHPTPVVQIQYTTHYKQLRALFTKVLQADEKSTRALKLSEAVIHHNAANYTAWQFRRACIRQLASDDDDAPPSTDDSLWRQELAFCTAATLDNPKNYQVWFHRRACVEALGDPSAELEFVAQVLDDDAKNYHAWGHRQWVLRTYALWEAELDYVDRLLDEDVRNNSAWNQRHFVIEQTGGFDQPETLRREAAFALSHIRRAPSNASPWNYLRGLVEKVPRGAAAVDEMLPDVRPACEELAIVGECGNCVEGPSEDADSGAACVMAISLLVELLEAGSEEVQYRRGVRLCDKLASLDPIRHKYWEWRRNMLEAKCVSSDAKA